jgi:protein-S-isoprenylcysteine O-methyltransferase Ste14
MTLFKLILGCWDIFFVFWLINAFSNKRTVERQSVGSRLQYSVFFGLALWLLFVSGYHRSHHALGLVVLPHSTEMNLVGLVLTVLGLLLAIWARVVLGGNWSGSVTFKEDHELIVRGPYALVRHPIYTALLLMYLGTELAIGTVGGLVGWPIFFLSFWIKFRQEEALMIAHFGEQYSVYRKRVRALIPFVF